MSAELQEAFNSISKIVEAAKADRERFGNIAATIRVNALRNGATTNEAEAMVRGDVDFLKWVSAKVEANTTPPEHDPQDCTEDDGCPTEKAVLKRFWREHRTRTDLSQASVAAALEAAANAAWLAGPSQDLAQEELSDIGKERRDMAMRCEAAIRALITPAQHDALAAHVAAEVAKARADEFNRGVRAGCYAALAHLDRHDYREDVTRSGLQDEILAAQIGAKP